MRNLHRIRALGCAAFVLLGCGRTLTEEEQAALAANDDAGREGSGSSGEAGSRASEPGDDDTRAGTARAGASGSELPPAGSADDASSGSTGGTGAPSVPGTGAVGGTTTPPPPPLGSGGAGSGGSGAPDGPENPHASDVLNPQRCATEEPFVLAIDPGGASGEVRGWLESAPTVVFDELDLPRFGTGLLSSGGDELMLWWSIASLDEATFWLYVQDASTEVAHVPVRTPGEIGDATLLTFTGWGGGLGSVGPVKVDEMTVFHHIPTDRYLALQVLDVYGAEDSERRDICAAIDARWLLAPRGTGDFSAFR